VSSGYTAATENNYVHIRTYKLIRHCCNSSPPQNLKEGCGLELRARIRIWLALFALWMAH